nr:hypothetical protein [Candidatus Sigynarchaeota archaeon]
MQKAMYSFRGLTGDKPGKNLLSDVCLTGMEGWILRFIGLDNLDEESPPYIYFSYRQKEREKISYEHGD